MTVDAAVLHKLDKEPHQGDARVTPRQGALALTPKVIELVEKIDALYGHKANKGYGRFEADVINYPSSQLLTTLYDGGATFIETSQQLLQVLAQRANAQPLARGGYVLMAQLSGDNDARWFLVAIINNVSGPAVDEATLEVVESMHVDLENLRVAGRVNVAAWRNADDTGRYVGFLKHRGDVAEYFKSFLGCNDVTSPSSETRTLLTALKAFAATEQMLPERQEEFIRSAYNFCDERASNNEPLSLDALANALWPNDPDRLRAAFAAEAQPVSDHFVPHKGALRTFVRIRAKTPNWTLDLQRQALFTGDAQYLPESQTLVLRNLPADLIAALEDERAEAGPPQ